MLRNLIRVGRADLRATLHFLVGKASGSKKHLKHHMQTAAIMVAILYFINSLSHEAFVVAITYAISESLTSA